MRLSVLGSAGSYPAVGRPASGYLVRADGTSLVIDLGPGTFERLAGQTDPFEVDAIVLSHRHPDHCADLFALFHHLAYGPRTRRGLRLLAPQAVVDALAGFLAAGPDHLFWAVFDVTIVDDGDRLDAGPVSIRFVGMDHSTPTVGVRLEHDGRVLAYTADTGPGSDWQSLAGNADLLLAEATLQGDRTADTLGGHLTADEAGRFASEVGARSLMLTHIPVALDADRSVEEAERAFGRQVELAVPGTERKV